MTSPACAQLFTPSFRPTPRSISPCSLRVSVLSSPNHPHPLSYPRRTPIPLQKDENNGDQTLNLAADADADDDASWSSEELEAISSLFERKPPQKPMKPVKQRPLPLPLPRPSQTPSPKHHVRLAARSVLSFRSLSSDRVRKNPETLASIAREIQSLPCDVHAHQVLDKWSPSLRKGSLSLIVRELGHMCLPDRALQALCWAQDHRPDFFPDDRVLASTVEVLARSGKLKIEAEMERKYLNSASRSVVEAMARGFIAAGNLHRARRLLLLAKDNNRTLDTSIHAKLIMAAGKTPEGYKLALALLEELGEREDFDLKPQDCTGIMKVCIKIGKFEVVENLFKWFKDSGRSPNIVMYTTVIHSRYRNGQYREGMALIWEMEGLNFVLDLAAYRVVIKLCVVLNDLVRAFRYLSKMKEAGFSPTYDIYREMINAYAHSGRIAKCKQLCKEMKMVGMKLDKDTLRLLSQMEVV